MLFGHVSSVAANGCLLAQCLWYYKVTHAKDKPAEAGAVTLMVARRLGYTRGGKRKTNDTEDEAEYEDPVAG